MVKRAVKDRESARISVRAGKCDKRHMTSDFVFCRMILEKDVVIKTTSFVLHADAYLGGIHYFIFDLSTAVSEEIISGTYFSCNIFLREYYQNLFRGWWSEQVNRSDY